MPPRDVDIAIIGAGTAGMAAYRVARAATDKIALIEAGPYGTTCARAGCMPSKLLIAAAEAAEGARDAEAFGVHANTIIIDGVAVMKRVRRERDRFVGFVLEAVDSFDPKHRIKAKARFIDPHTLALDNGDEIRADRIVIATGSTPVWPTTFASAADRLITNEDVFELPTLPNSIAVFGGGVIGLELGQALSRLGVRVRIFGKGGGVGPLTDPVVRDAAIGIIGANVPFAPDADIGAISREGDEIIVRFSEGGKEQVERFDYLLAATGRKPNLDTLDIEKSGIELDEKGAPKIDPLTMRVDESHIFIAGDVSNRLPVLHEAADDGRIAGANAASYPEVLAHTRRVPLGIVFTDPNIATIGKSFGELQALPCKFAIGEVDFHDQGRSRVMRKNAGLLRIYAECKSGLFLGAEMIGPRGENIAHLLAWSAQQRLDVSTMLDMPFYHPVIEEGVRTALRDVCQKLRLKPKAPPHSIDCGPGA